MGLATIAGDRSVAPGQRENASSAEHTAGLIQINVCFGRLPVIGNKQRYFPQRNAPRGASSSPWQQLMSARRDKCDGPNRLKRDGDLT
jgi:hypothetical protein